MTMYVSLFVVGLLCILASQAIKPRGDGDNLAELALLIADAQSIRAESQSLLEQLETLGEGDPGLLGQLLDYKVRFESVDQRITALASQRPDGGEQEQAELQAQARATELAEVMRPKVAEAFALVRATIAKAALQGLVRVESVSDPSLPAPVMMTAYQQNERPHSFEDSGLVISFNQDWQWTVYVEPGRVKSPTGLAEWSEGTDFLYPMLRVTEDGATLATVSFDPQTADLTIAASETGSRFAQALNALKSEYQKEELVANAILDLVQDAKVRQSTD